MKYLFITGSRRFRNVGISKLLSARISVYESAAGTISAAGYASPAISDVAGSSTAEQ